MSDNVFEEYNNSNNPDLRRRRSSNHETTTTTTPKIGVSISNNVTIAKQTRHLHHPSPQRQRPSPLQQQQQQQHHQQQQQQQSPPRSYLPSPNQKYNPNYHFVAVRSRSVDSRSTATSTTTCTGGASGAVVAGAGVMAQVAAARTSFLDSSVVGGGNGNGGGVSSHVAMNDDGDEQQEPSDERMNLDNDDDDEHNDENGEKDEEEEEDVVVEMPPIPPPPIATDAPSLNDDESSSRCSNSRAGAHSRTFQEYMAGKMTKSLELERQLIFETTTQQQQQQQSQQSQPQAPQSPPHRKRSDPNTSFFDTSQSCSSSPPEPANYYSTNHDVEVQQQQQGGSSPQRQQHHQQQQQFHHQHDCSPSRSEPSAFPVQQQQKPSSSHSSPQRLAVVQQEQEQQQQHLSPANKSTSFSGSAAISLSKRLLLATTTALVESAEEPLLRGSTTTTTTTTTTMRNNVPSTTITAAEEVEWRKHVDDGDSGMMEEMEAAATATTSTKHHAHAHHHHHHNTTITTTASSSKNDNTSHNTTSSRDQVVGVPPPASAQGGASWDDAVLRESWDDIQNSTTPKAVKAAAAAAALQPQQQPQQQHAQSSQPTSAFGNGGADNDTNQRRRRAAALHHIQAGRGRERPQQQQRQLQQHSQSPQRRRMVVPGLAAPSLSPPTIAARQQQQQQHRQAGMKIILSPPRRRTVAELSTMERRLSPSPLEEHQRRHYHHQQQQVPVKQGQVAIMKQQLQQQMTAKQRRAATTTIATTTPSCLQPLKVLRNAISPPRHARQDQQQHQQRLTVAVLRRHRPINTQAISPKRGRQGPRAPAASAAPRSTLSPPSPTAPLAPPPRQQQQHPQQQAPQQLSPTSRALAARQVANNIKHVRQFQHQQRQDRLYQPGLPQAASSSSNHNMTSDSSRQPQPYLSSKQRQPPPPPPPPLPSLISGISSVTLTTSSEPCVSLDDPSLVSFSSSADLFQDEEKKQEEDTAAASAAMIEGQEQKSLLDINSDSTDNMNDGKDDSFWEPSHSQSEEFQQLNNSNTTSDSQNAVSPPRKGGDERNSNETDVKKPASTTPKIASNKKETEPTEKGSGGGRLGDRITANKKALEAKSGSKRDNDVGSNFSWESLDPSHQVTASVAGNSHGGVVLSPVIASPAAPTIENAKASSQEAREQDNNACKQDEKQEVVPFLSEITAIPKIEEDDSLEVGGRTIFSNPVREEEKNDSQSRMRNGQPPKNHESLPPSGVQSPPPLMQTSSLISPSEMTRRHSVPQDVLVTVGGSLDNGDDHNPRQKHQESFYHSSHILAYASPILSQHLVAVGKNNYRLDLPRATSREWKLLQQFLEPHSVQVAVLTAENLPTLIPWFNELQLEILLKQCDQLLSTLDIVMDHHNDSIDGNDDHDVSPPSAEDWTDLLTLAEICTLCALPQCHKKTLLAVQFCLEWHPGLCVDLPVLNKLTRLLQGDVAARSTLWGKLSPYLPEELVEETRTTSQVQQLVHNALFPYLLREGLREAVSLLEEERKHQVQTEQLLKWKQRKKELALMPDGDDPVGDIRNHSIIEDSAEISDDVSNANSILQTNSVDLKVPSTPPSRDEILLSRSVNDDYINHSNIQNTPNTSNSSTSFLGYSTSGTGNMEGSFNNDNASASNSSPSSRLMRKLERPRPGIKQRQLDSISGDIQRKLNKDPFLGYVDLHHNIAEWWESWNDEKPLLGKDEQRQDESKKELLPIPYRRGGSETTTRTSHRPDKPVGLLRICGAETAQSTSGGRRGNSKRHEKSSGKSSPAAASASSRNDRLKPENRTVWLDSILHRLMRPPMFPSATGVVKQQVVPHQQNHCQQPTSNHLTPVVTPPASDRRRTFAC